MYEFCRVLGRIKKECMRIKRERNARGENVGDLKLKPSFMSLLSQPHCIDKGSWVDSERGLIKIGGCLSDGVGLRDYGEKRFGVVTENGIKKVTHVFNGGRQAVRRVKTKLGYELGMTGEHKIFIYIHSVIAWKSQYL